MQKIRHALRILSHALLAGLFTSMTWAGPTAAPVINVYKSPTCGCCVKWIDHLKANGFAVRSHDTGELTRHKQRLGIPAGYDSCHTAEVGGYVIEGHVPAKDIKRLLKEKPPARGLTVPGMPVGSPGMEQGSQKEAYDVTSRFFPRAGRRRLSGAMARFRPTTRGACYCTMPRP